MNKGKYLAHFGIQGMKWGVRRFQNEDGTLTPEGKVRYGYSISERVTKDGVEFRNNKSGESVLVKNMTKNGLDDLYKQVANLSVEILADSMDMPVSALTTMMALDPKVFDAVTTFTVKQYNIAVSDLIKSENKKQKQK